MNMPDPQCKADLQRALGMINYLGQFVPNLSAKTENLRNLLRNGTDFQWMPEHVREWNEVKEVLT